MMILHVLSMFQAKSDFVFLKGIIISKKIEGGLERILDWDSEVQN